MRSATADQLCRSKRHSAALANSGGCVWSAFLIAETKDSKEVFSKGAPAPRMISCVAGIAGSKPDKLRLRQPRLAACRTLRTPRSKKPPWFQLEVSGRRVHLMGGFTLAMAKACPAAEIHSFEPAHGYIRPTSQKYRFEPRLPRSFTSRGNGIETGAVSLSCGPEFASDEPSSKCPLGE
jgi:hypothetical protein